MQKHKIMKEWKAIGILFLFVLPAVTCIKSVGISTLDVLYVDDDNVDGPWDGTSDHPYQHIQDAIDNASDGDTIFVFRGTYSSISVLGKNLTLMGEDKKNTIIKYNNSEGIRITKFYLGSYSESPDSFRQVVNIRFMSDIHQ